MATLNAWLGKHARYGADELSTLTPDELASAVYVTHYDLKNDGYTLVGTAEVQITLTPRPDRIAAQVAALRAEKRQLQAETERRCTEIERRVQSLLALEMAA